MTDLRALTDEAHQRLREHTEPSRIEFMARSCPTAMEVIGVRAPVIHQLVADLARRLREQPDVVRGLAFSLVEGGTLEGRQVGYLLLSKVAAARRSLTLADISALGEGMDNWATVDTFSALIAGQAWREGALPGSVVEAWLRSDDRWWRRAAVVCTVALNLKQRGGTGDAERTLAICEQVVGDRDDMVVKAVSWALRTLIPWDRRAVIGFLERHGDTIAPRVRREVRNKLETGLKIPKGAS